jgi:transketolase
VYAVLALGWVRGLGGLGRILSIEKYGASAPYKAIYEHYGLTSPKLLEMAKELLGGN